MLRILSFIALFIFLGAGAAQASCVYQAQKPAASAELRRGVNLSRWWEDERDQTLSSNDDANLHALGFDFVRLPLSPTWLAFDDEDEQKEKLTQLRCDIVALLNEQLTVIIDLHAPSDFQKELARNSDNASMRLEKIWQRMQPALEGLPPDRILIGLYNEPHIETGDWWSIQGKLARDLRSSFPHNPFVVMAGPDGGPWDLARMKPYADKNVIYDFHFYQPMFFTHHGAEWLPSAKPQQKAGRIAYPVAPDMQAADDDSEMKDYIAADWNRAELAAFIDKIARWGKHKGARIACLEFGVYRPYVDGKSRANWLRDVRELLEKNNIPWALWEYRGGFGLLDRDGAPDQGIVNALGLNHSSAP